MKIKRIIVLSLLVFILFILQHTLLNVIKLGNVTPNICLVLVITIAYCNGSGYGAVFGFIMGFIYDVFFGTFLGFESMLYVLIGYLTGLLHETFFDFNFNLKIPSLLFGIGCFIHNIVYYFFFYLLNGDLNFTIYLKQLIIPETIYTIVLGLIIYRLLFLIDQKLSLDERKADGYFVS